MRRAAYDDYTSLPFFIGGRCVCDQIHCNCNSWDREIPSEGLIDLQMIKESAHIHPPRRFSIGGSDFVFMVLLFTGKVMVAFLVAPHSARSVDGAAARELALCRRIVLALRVRIGCGWKEEHFDPPLVYIRVRTGPIGHDLLHLALTPHSEADLDCLVA